MVEKLQSIAIDVLKSNGWKELRRRNRGDATSTKY